MDSLEALATLALDNESAEEATRIFGASSTLRAASGTTRWPVRQPAHQTDVERARELLGPEQFDAAWAEGAALTADEAVGYLSRATRERKRPSAGWASLTRPRYASSIWRPRD